MKDSHANCPVFATTQGNDIESVSAPITFSTAQTAALIESACARSFQVDGVACISLLDLEMILQKGVSKCEKESAS